MKGKIKKIVKGSAAEKVIKLSIAFTTSLIGFVIFYHYVIFLPQKERIELVAIVSSPVIAVAIGEWLRKCNYSKRQRDDLVRRLIGYGYQMSPTYRSEKNEILGALNEIKYWHSSEPSIKKLVFSVMDKMGSGQDAQDAFIGLVQAVAQKEGHCLSRQEIERVFSTK